MTITPINIWKDGVELTATEFTLTSIFDDLLTKATFYYQLDTEEGLPVTNGNLYMEEEYTDWDGTNAWAYNWALTKLGLQ